MLGGMGIVLALLAIGYCLRKRKEKKGFWLVMYTIVPIGLGIWILISILTIVLGIALISS